MGEHKSLALWLATAVSGIAFPPDRRAVEAELRAHIEDKTADFRRIFPDMTEDEARDRALGEMGDAEELKISLARVHKPWLGWLWTASRWLLWGALAVCLAVCLLRSDYYQSAGFPLWTDWSAPCPAPADRVPEGAELGGYTFQVTEAAYWEEDGEYVLTLRASSPRFWERLGEEALDGLSVLRPDGSRWTVGQEIPGTGAFATAHLARWGLFRREFRFHVPAEDWEPGDWVVLELESQKGGLRLSVQVTEGVENG